jgi:hypothetical protein|eukprot:COSAG03_NODE_1914_length_3363_cov_503.950674_3_plen_166_part_00
MHGMMIPRTVVTDLSTNAANVAFVLARDPRSADGALRNIVSVVSLSPSPTACTKSRWCCSSRYLTEHQVGQNTNSCRVTSAMPQEDYDRAPPHVRDTIKFVHSTISPVKATYRVKDRRLSLQTPICDILRTPDTVTKGKLLVAIHNTVHRSLAKPSGEAVMATAV